MAPVSTVPSESESTDCDVFRILFLGPTGLGKSTCINKFMGFAGGDVGHLDEHGQEKVPGSAKVKQAGWQGTTAFCTPYKSQNIDSRRVEIVDTIGIGTIIARDALQDAGSSEGCLFVDLKEMKANGIKFHAVVFWANAMDSSAGLALPAKAILDHCYLKGKRNLLDRPNPNLILNGAKADPRLMDEGCPSLRDEFVSSIATAFFEAPVGIGTVTYTYMENPRRWCEDLNIEGLIQAIKATPNWQNFETLNDDDLFDFSWPSPNEIDDMFSPIMKSTFTHKMIRSRLDHIKATMKEMVDQHETLQRTLNDAKEGQGQRDAMSLAQIRHNELICSTGPTKFTVPMLRRIAEEKALRCPHRKVWTLKGMRKQASRIEIINAIVRCEFPLANWGVGPSSHAPVTRATTDARAIGVHTVTSASVSDNNAVASALPGPAGTLQRGQQGASSLTIKRIETRKRQGVGYMYTCELADGSTRRFSGKVARQLAPALIDKYDLETPRR